MAVLSLDMYVHTHTHTWCFTSCLCVQLQIKETCTFTVEPIISGLKNNQIWVTVCQQKIICKNWYTEIFTRKQDLPFQKKIVINFWMFLITMQKFFRTSINTSVTYNGPEITTSTFQWPCHIKLPLLPDNASRRKSCDAVTPKLFAAAPWGSVEYFKIFFFHSIYVYYSFKWLLSC